MSKKNLNETAGGGAVGSGGIAVRTDGPGISGNERRSLQRFLQKFNKKVTNRYKYHQVPFPIKISEAFDLQDVLSRLRGIEGKKLEPRDHVTYGVEDDEGNVMKITVRKDQAAEFEAILGQELADIEAFSVSGKEGKNVSMAELLYNLKDKFDIIDVEFPKIPTDVVYNADKATVQTGPDIPPAQDQVDGTGGPGGDLGVGDEMGDLGDEGGLPPVATGNEPIDLNDVEGGEDLGDLGGQPPAAGELGDELETDAEGVEAFAEPENEGSILDKVLDMLKAQADAQKAQAEAEAEKYRADQAEYSARAASATIAQQEELARMEADMERQKNRDKEAKKLADIAKYRVQQASGIAAGVNEAEELETVQSVRRLLALAAVKFAVQPEDSPETRQFKNAQKTEYIRELQSRLRSAKNREMYNADVAKREKMQQNQQRQQGQQPNQQQQQQAPGQANQASGQQPTR